MINSIYTNFLGAAPNWYKNTIISFLIANPIILIVLKSMGLPAGFILGWIILIQFIFTLAMALKCYPLQPGGLIAIESVIMGLTDTKQIYYEVDANLKVILLLVFMVAGIYFMKDFLLFIFTKLLINIKNKRTLSLLFVFSAAFLSAFLDALTVTAVLISVCLGFYKIFDEHHKSNQISANEFSQGKSFLSDIVMHGAVGTALGGVCTIVGEPQNLLIATKAGWEFTEFFMRMAPITMPVLVMGILTCFAIEKFKLASYGALVPESLRLKIIETAEKRASERSDLQNLHLKLEALLGVCLIIALGLHLAPVGIIGLFLLVGLTSLKGVISEHKLGPAFEESLPFTALLVVFFAIVAVINDQALFTPIISVVLQSSIELQAPMFYIANGILSAISDNVFVATVYMNEIVLALENNVISREQFDKLAIAINTGTNLPSVATPNGQAAFLFLLTSSLAPLIGLSYLRMVIKALPYTIVLTLVGLGCVIAFL
jgi:NhaB family Na+:H+ antiporter